MEDFSLLGCFLLDMGQATRASNSFSNMWRTGCTGNELIAQCQNTSEKGNKCYDVMINCVSHCHSNVVQVHKEENMPLNWLG